MKLICLLCSYYNLSLDLTLRALLSTSSYPKTVIFFTITVLRYVLLGVAGENGINMATCRYRQKETNLGVIFIDIMYIFCRGIFNLNLTRNPIILVGLQWHTSTITLQL